MAKFEALAYYSTFLRIELDADTLEEAMKLANNTDGGDWAQVGMDGWTVTDVIQLEED